MIKLLLTLVPIRYRHHLRGGDTRRPTGAHLAYQYMDDHDEDGPGMRMKANTVIQIGIYLAAGFVYYLGVERWPADPAGAVFHWTGAGLLVAINVWWIARDHRP